MGDKEEGGEEKKIISIRGIDKKLYEELSRMAKELGKTVGELINEAMAFIISLREGVEAAGIKFKEGLESSLCIHISNLGELTVTRKDLEDAYKPVIFRDIKTLKFSENIDEELFEDKVKRIIKVNTLIIPNNLSKIKVLSKCLYVNSVKTE